MRTYASEKDLRVQQLGLQLGDRKMLVVGGKTIDMVVEVCVNPEGRSIGCSRSIDLSLADEPGCRLVPSYRDSSRRSGCIVGSCVQYDKAAAAVEQCGVDVESISNSLCSVAQRHRSSADARFSWRVHVVSSCAPYFAVLLLKIRHQLRLKKNPRSTPSGFAVRSQNS